MARVFKPNQIKHGCCRSGNSQGTLYFFKVTEKLGNLNKCEIIHHVLVFFMMKDSDTFPFVVQAKVGLWMKSNILFFSLISNVF